MLPYCLFFLLVCGMLLWVTILKKDLFPFSWYPMYSAQYKAQQVRVVRIALQDKNGGVNWWNSKYYRYPEFTARKLDKLMQLTFNNNIEGTVNLLEQKRLLAKVLQLIEQEEGTLKDYSAFLIIERRVDAALNVHDTIQKTFLLSEIRHGMVC